MKVSFLGTNGWYDTGTGNTICILVQFQGYNVVFDAGNGLYKIPEHVREGDELFLFLSHFHLDHIAGLHVLNGMKHLSAVKIYGPAGTRKILSRFVNIPFTVPLKALPFPVTVSELPGGRKPPFNIHAKPLRHASLTLGYRIETDEGVIAYCPDTGYCRNAVMLAKNADLLLAECAYRSGQTSAKWPHLNPETAARIAQEAGAKRLALVHFDASLYRTLKERRKAGSQARKFFRNTFAAEDGRTISLQQRGDRARG